KHAQEISEVLALVQRRIEEKDFAGAARASMAKTGEDLFAAQVILPVIAFRIVAKLALEHATARRFQQEHLLVRRIEDARKVRRAELIQVGQRRPKRRPASGIVALAPSPWRHIEPGDGHRRCLIAKQAEQEIRKSLLALADGGKVIVRRLQHPGVVRRNLRAAEDDTRLRQVTSYF